MTHHNDLRSADAVPEQPAMELLDGAQAAETPATSLVTRIARGSLYGVLLVSATALLAISAVPELASYATFIPDNTVKGTCSLSSGGCATVDVAKLQSIQGSPCCLEVAAAAVSTSCSKSCAFSEAVAGVSPAEASSCCLESSVCCEEGACPLTIAEAAGDSTNEESLDDALAKLPVDGESVPPAPPLAE